MKNYNIKNKKITIIIIIVKKLQITLYWVY